MSDVEYSPDTTTDVDKTMETLDHETKKALGALYGAPGGVAEVTIATLGYWPRVLLVEENVIEPFEDEPGAGTDEAKQRPAEVVLTRYADEVMAACSAELAEEIQATETDAEKLERAHEKYLAARGSGQPYYG